MIDVAAKKLLLTRAAEDSDAWAKVIQARGGMAICLPCIQTETLADAPTAAALRAALDTAGWLALTSRRGVQAVAELLDGALRLNLSVAAVGETTAAACSETLGRCDLVAAGGTGLSLARDLAEHIGPVDASAPAPRVVAAAADRARPHLEQVLAPLGIEVVRVNVYRTLPAAAASGPRQDLAQLGLDAILLASPSAAEGLLNLAEVPASMPVVSIGPSTTEAARALGLAVAAEASHPDLEGLLEAVP